MTKKHKTLRAVFTTALCFALVVLSLLPCSAAEFERAELLTDDYGYQSLNAQIEHFGKGSIFVLEVTAHRDVSSPFGVQIWVQDSEPSSATANFDFIPDGNTHVIEASEHTFVNKLGLDGLLKLESSSFKFQLYNCEIDFYILVYKGDTTVDFISMMFSGFGETISGLTDGVKTTFNSIIFENGSSESGLSDFAKFGFLMGGVTMALGLGYFIIKKVRG